MSKTARSDWSASCPWDGITGKPAIFGVTDISQLTGTGYLNGQVPAFNSTTRRFVPSTPSSGSTPVPPATNPLPAQITIEWDVPSVMPLQSAFQDFPLLGAVPGEPLAWGVSTDMGFCQPFARIRENDSIRLFVVNFDSVAIDIPNSLWQIQRFQ